jgi:predicted  nucleic acid-binding Zn-ribbon protein
MGEREEAALTVYQSVRCLECGVVYSKPVRGGTLTANPGCPDCGYLGWLPLTVPVTRDLFRSRSAADRLRQRPAN